MINKNAEFDVLLFCPLLDCSVDSGEPGWSLKGWLLAVLAVEWTCRPRSPTRAWVSLLKSRSSPSVWADRPVLRPGCCGCCCDCVIWELWTTDPSGQVVRKWTWQNHKVVSMTCSCRLLLQHQQLIWKCHYLIWIPMKLEILNSQSSEKIFSFLPDVQAAVSFSFYTRTKILKLKS